MKRGFSVLVCVGSNGGIRFDFTHPLYRIVFGPFVIWICLFDMDAVIARMLDKGRDAK